VLCQVGKECLGFSRSFGIWRNLLGKDTVLASPVLLDALLKVFIWGCHFRFSQRSGC